MTRLKYYKMGNELMTDWFTIGPNKIIRGVIDTTTNTIKVVEFDGEVVAELRTKNLRQAKTLLKHSLSISRVNFDGEIRKR